MRQRICYLFMVLLIFRFLTSLIISSYLDPDEFWQSLEIAYLYVFGYGVQTWEWYHKIRSPLFPLIFAAGYSILRYLNLNENHILMMAMPKFIMALFAATADLFTFLCVQRYYGTSAAYWALFASLTSAFHLIYATRTLSNAAEMSLSAVALYFWPTYDKFAVSGTNSFKSFGISLFFIGVSCIMRPTSVLFWIVPVLVLIHADIHRPKTILRLTLLTLSLICLLVSFSIALDSWFYGELVFSCYRFFKYNILFQISHFYGVLPFLWYFYAAVPFLLAGWLPFFLLGISITYGRSFFLKFIAGAIFLFSLLAHKEFRFVYPVLPAMLIYVGHGINTFVNKVSSVPRLKKLFIIALCALFNIILALFINQYFKVGSMGVSHFLNKRVSNLPPEDRKKINIFWLTHCHPGPWYSVVNYNVTMDFLRCEPPLQPFQPQRFSNASDDYAREDLSFFSNFSLNVKKLLSMQENVNVLVFYDRLLSDPEFSSALSSLDFEPFFKTFNSLVCVDDQSENILIYKKKYLHL